MRPLRPARPASPVVIDPLVRFARPVVVDDGVATERLWELFDAGETVEPQTATARSINYFATTTQGPRYFSLTGARRMIRHTRDVSIHFNSTRDP